MKIMLIGDYIEDMFFLGQTVGLSNHEPTPKFVPSSHYVTPGGIGYCEALFRSFLPSDVELITLRLSDASIVRYIDTGVNKTQFTIHTTPTIYTEHHDKNFLLQYIDKEKPDFLFFWTDAEADEAIYSMSIYHKTQALDRLDLISALLSKGIIAVDLSPSISDFVTYMSVNFAKVYAKQINHHMDRSEHPLCLIGTDSKELRSSMYVQDPNKKGGLPDKRHKVSLNVQPIPFLVDTCGAGDTYFTALLSTLIREDKLSCYDEQDIEYAMKIGHAAAHITCSNLGTYIPTWNQVIDKYKELNDVIS